MVNDLTFTWEPISYLLTCGLEHLGFKHWEEAQTDKVNFPFNLDWEGYQRSESGNSLRVCAVRWRGHLVGYAVVNTYMSLQSKGVWCAYISEFYIEPAFRKKEMSGIKLFRFIVAQLKLINVKQVTTHYPEMVLADRGGLGKFFKFLGFKSQGQLVTRSI